jgi:hypothetical protein
VEMNSRLELELQRGLREVTAPAELWNRVQAARVAPPSVSSGRGPVWAMAAAVVLITVGLSVVHRDNAGFPAPAGDRCQNPAQLRAWVRAKTGLDLPLRADSSPSLQLSGAQLVDGTHGVKIAYRAGNRDAVLLVSRADGSEDTPHSRFGQRFTLASSDPADLQLACKLCHLD